MKAFSSTVRNFAIAVLVLVAFSTFSVNAKQLSLRAAKEVNMAVKPEALPGKTCKKLGAKCLSKASCCKYRILDVECRRKTKTSPFKTCMLPA